MCVDNVPTSLTTKENVVQRIMHKSCPKFGTPPSTSWCLLTSSLRADTSIAQEEDAGCSNHASVAEDDDDDDVSCSHHASIAEDDTDDVGCSNHTSIAEEEEDNGCSNPTSIA